MKTDNLKKYIDSNREEFDHLEPSRELFLKLEKDIKAFPSPPITKKLWASKTIWAAASITIIITGLYFLTLTKPETNSPKTVIANKKANSVPDIEATTTIPNKDESIQPVVKFSAVRRKASLNIKEFNINEIYSQLSDSSSSSNRLAAIISLEKSKLINYDVVDKLADALNNDQNSNVRLAALDLLNKYNTDRYVAGTIIKSLAHQNDPVIQLNLLHIVRKYDHPLLDSNLLALAVNPNSINEIKNEVYSILLNQNKL